MIQNAVSLLLSKDRVVLRRATLALVLVEAIISTVIVQFVRYTNIDWNAYMQEVGGFLSGEHDYTKLQGDTGPLVYPAGFVYLYSLLFHVTDSGQNVRLAQYLFVAFYCLCIALVLSLYTRTRSVPLIGFLFVVFTSYRVHSIFVLRLFNDPLAMIFLYSSIHCILSEYWVLACALFSFGVSIKMNILLFSPALLLILLRKFGLRRTLPLLGVCASIQVLLGLPFLLENPFGYLLRSFELSRQFMYIWSVNMKFLSEELFLDRQLHVCLLIGHLFVLFLFAFYRWSPNVSLFKTAFSWNPLKETRPFSQNEIVVMLFTSNLVGMSFARSLHYQFYVWYYHSLPFLVWKTNLHLIVKLGLLSVIELCWNVYPANSLSSAALTCAHLTLICALFFWSDGRPQKEKGV